MNRLIPHGVGLVCALTLGAVIAAGTAHAQAVNPLDNPGGLLSQGASMAPANSAKHTELPPALPGATQRSGGPAPATQVPADMSPNAALFDAINRGDIAAARDAMSRGAELDAHNVLGMTPMELSVDLGRNDISFLLLSYRGSGSSGGPPPQASAQTAAPAAPHAAAKLAKPAARPMRTASRGPVAGTPAAPPADPPATPQGSRLFANDGGSPVPSAGFLGFGSGGSTR